ncbi:hypothetical protein PPTG_22432 [Phytophthora nicotianae INRA-310]|uniref:Uncharacterized protein n=1 Tax=Phytophthora nicotianae (strain INRA-310) TaxID=761204 RepID=W2QJ57_PHYN3|nr:hypothetical protein PPTG_22432 [Phytophthora nicotianae INRA-310]ETN12931.1 hypothetical protein PPTG_22432 [Phytophthora nicotianae INRA-310]
MASLQQSILQAVNKMDSTRTTIVQDIVNELERRAIGAGTVTYNGLNDMIMSAVQHSTTTSKGRKRRRGQLLWQNLPAVPVAALGLCARHELRLLREAIGHVQLGPQNQNLGGARPGLAPRVRVERAPG